MLADVLITNPDLIEQLALCLDREMRLISNWKHLSRELKVDAHVIKSLEQYGDFSPTIRLFEYLEVTQPDLTIQQLKQALLDIRRNDLVSLLTTKVITYRLIKVKVKDKLTNGNMNPEPSDNFKYTMKKARPRTVIIFVKPSFGYYKIVIDMQYF